MSRLFRMEISFLLMEVLRNAKHGIELKDAMTQHTTQGRKVMAQQNLNDIIDSISLAIDSIKRKSDVQLFPNETRGDQGNINVEKPATLSEKGVNDLFPFDFSRSNEKDTSTGEDDDIQIISETSAKNQRYDSVTDSALHLAVKRNECRIPVTYTCSLCSASFSEITHLDRHTTLLHKNNFSSNLAASEETIECKICGKILSCKTRAKHMIKHDIQAENRQCQHCFRSFASHSGLKRHITSIHMGISSGWYHCRLCNEAFNSVAAHRIHYASHTASRAAGLKRKMANRPAKSDAKKSAENIQYSYLPSEIGNPASSLSAIRELDCPICPLKFITKPDLFTHVNKDHEWCKPALHVCDVCGALFLGKVALEVHLQQQHKKECIVLIVIDRLVRRSSMKPI